MHSICFENYSLLSKFVAQEIIAQIKAKPNLVVSLAGGDTPKLAYTFLVEQLLKEKIDYSQIFFVSLDEWVGLPKDNTGSCFAFIKEYLFDPLQLNHSQYHFFDALTTDLDLECKQMNSIIAQKGGIDFMLVGIGMNGHIGFNEPGTNFNSLANVIKLDAITKQVGQKYFDTEVALDKGITLGLGHLLEAKKVFLMASGTKKAAVIKNTIEGEISEDFPASILQQHQNAFVLYDADAGSLLQPKI